MLATMTEKGQVTAPKKLRDQLGISSGSKLDFESMDVVSAALKNFETSAAGFPDCLIVAKAGHAGCALTLTFDQRMKSLPGVRLL